MENADPGQRIGGSGRPFIGPPGEIAGSVTDHILIHVPLSACVRLVNILRYPGLAAAATTIVNVKQQHYTFYDHDRTGREPYCYTSSKLCLTSDNCHYMGWR